MARTSSTSVGISADSPEPLFRLSPVAGHTAEILDVEDQHCGYDAEKIPYQPLQRPMNPTARAGHLGR
jgi:hypothetical protein